jgi:hypothetical protein
MGRQMGNTNSIHSFPESRTKPLFAIKQLIKPP